MKPEKLASMELPVDGNDPQTNVTSLVTVTKTLCEALGKTPAEGALMLCTAAAFILDTCGVEKAIEDGEEPDYENIIRAYMQTAAYAWNVNGMMFRGITEDELQSVGVEIPGRGKETLQ